MNELLFGTVGSPISIPKKPGGSVGAIQQTAALGLGAMELGWVQSVRVSEKTCADIKITSKQQDIKLSVHAPYFINLNASDEEWPKSRKRLMDACHFGNLAGATDIIFHPGSYFAAEPSEVYKKAFPRLLDCANELKRNDNPVNLRPETMGKSAMLGSLEDTVQMALLDPKIKPCLDFAHLHARAGDGSMNSETEWSKLLEYYAKQLGEDSLQKLHIHLSGIEYSQKGERNHLPLKESDFDLIGLFKALKAMNCGGRVLCESPIMETDALLMKETWQSLV